MQNLSTGFFPQNGGLLSVLSIPAIHAIISRCFLGLCEVRTFVAEKRRYIMKLVVEFLMSICHGVVDFVSCIGCLLYTSPSPRDGSLSRMPSSA